MNIALPASVRQAGALAMVFVAVLVLGFAVAPSARGADPDLRGQWHLDEGAPGAGDDRVSGTPDSSGNGLNAIVRYTAEVPGRFASAFRFGLSSLTQVDSALLRPEHLTAIAWVRADASPGNLRYIVAQGGSPTCIPAAYGLYTSSSGGSNPGGLSFYVSHGGQAYHAAGVPASSVWNGGWHMVAGTFDGAKARFYLDGTEIGDGVHDGTDVPGAIDYSQPTSAFRIGRYGPYGVEPCTGATTAFEGDIDEVRIYSRALTASEIRTLAANTATSPPVVGDTPAPPAGTSAAPTTTIALDPAAPGAAGYYTNFVQVKVTATGSAPLETRCVLNPQPPPTSFDDLPSGCRFSGGARISGLGTHTIYAASRDGSGITTPMASRTFRLSEVPQTTIVSGPSGLTWRPDNFFYVSSNVNPSTFQCRIDRAAFKACSNPYETGTLSQTNHTFAVRAIAPGGAVDPTPARRLFKVAAPVAVQASCESNISAFTNEGKNGCFIGTVGVHGCAGYDIDCVIRHQTCPVGARCTVTTRSSWFDADRDIPWGTNAAAGLGNLEQAAASGYPATPVSLWQTCWTSGDHRCSVTTTLQVLGDGRPLWSLCAANIRSFPGLFEDFRSRIGDDTARRIHCEADWRVGPAAELVALPAGTVGPSGIVGPAGQVLQVSVFSPGMLSAVFTIPGPSTGPQIAPVRKAVTRAGTVTIPLKLNPAAKQLLKQKKKLTFSLRLRFIRNGERKISSQRVTIAAARDEASRRFCAAMKAANEALGSLFSSKLAIIC